MQTAASEFDQGHSSIHSKISKSKSFAGDFHVMCFLSTFS
jgi:hypothetical protein